MQQHSPPDDGKKSFFSFRSNIVLVGFLLIAAFFLLSEHWAHALGFLPYLLILACPLLHLFMHSGHGGHGGAPAQQDDDPGRVHRH
jgi:hypothetical protein